VFDRRGKDKFYLAVDRKLQVILAMMADSKNRHNIRIDIEMKNNSMRWTGTDAE